MDSAIVCGDALDVMPTLPDSCLGLIVTDPPYMNVKKSEWWDRQWDTIDGYIEWLDRLCQQWYRLLKPNGSLYVFASPKMAARVEVKISEWFNVLNRIRWVKEEGWHKKSVKDELRSYLSPWEEIIFAEHYGADSAAKGESGYGAKCDELRGFVFEPLWAYLDGERRRADVSFEQVRQMVGCADGSGLPSHWFTRSQWMLPTAENFAKLQGGFNQQGRRPAPLYEDYHDAPRSRFEQDHGEREYLRAEYEDLRRPFTVTADDQYTDVWDFPTVKFYPGKHPAEKPLELISYIIKVSSREGDMVADFFCGSGTTAEAAMNLNRRYFCCDIMPEWAEYSRRRVTQRRMNFAY